MSIVIVKQQPHAQRISDDNLERMMEVFSCALTEANGGEQVYVFLCVSDGEKARSIGNIPDSNLVPILSEVIKESEHRTAISRGTKANATH